jgi:tetratricopeptide (TPR) repeat protein
MTPIDRHYLELQFWNKLLRKNGLEFQSFFEGIMKSAFADFEIVKPYGRGGDRKNDGFRKKKGIYYQVYAPENPKVKQMEGARKARDDFDGLYKYWQTIYPIKEFHFVFNDKGLGVAPEVYDALSAMKKAFPAIEFDVLTSNKLEAIFFELSENQFLGLGFSTERRQVITSTTSFLESVEIDIDRGTCNFAEKALEKIKPTIDKLADNGLQLEYGLLESRSLTLRENITEAKKKYQRLIEMFPQDVRPLLLLSEIYLIEEDYESNQKLLFQADSIDKDNWLCRLEHLLRDLRLGTPIDVSHLDETVFPSEKRAKSTYYRIYAAVFSSARNYSKADEFIQKAILYNPDRFANYELKLSIQEMQLFSTGSASKEEYQKYQIAVDSFAEKWQQYGELSTRNRISIDLKTLFILSTDHKFPQADKLAGQLFINILKCYFDKSIDDILCGFLGQMILPGKDVDSLQNYFKTSGKVPSDKLVRMLLLQFAQ